MSAKGQLVAKLPKVNSAKLHGENRVYIHPVCALGGDRYKCSKGWKVVGWAEAPWKSTLGPHAIVYEKTTPANSESIYASSHHYFEPGLYWGHGNAKKMTFFAELPKEDADELGPWVN